MWKLEIPPSEFCLISCDSDKIGIQKLPSYSMLQKARFTAFAFFELLRKIKSGLYLRNLISD